jgi:uncharacterized phage infection (PIP) family protein YhgE
MIKELRERLASVGERLKELRSRREHQTKLKAEAEETREKVQADRDKLIKKLDSLREKDPKPAEEIEDLQIRIAKLHDRAEQLQEDAHAADQRLEEIQGTVDEQLGREEELKQRIKKAQERKEASLESMSVATSSGASHWGGAGDVMAEFTEPFMVKRGLPIGSGKRTPAHNAAIGGSPTSDHLTTQVTTAARDFPTFSGEDDARALAKAMGNSGWTPDSFDTFQVTVDKRAFQVQILWGAAIKHGDHVHVGISRA